MAVKRNEHGRVIQVEQKSKHRPRTITEHMDCYHVSLRGWSYTVPKRGKPA